MKHKTLLSVLMISFAVHSQAQIITTIAGTNMGWEVENTIATEVTLHQPGAITVDNAGNIYFAEPSRHVVRKIDAHGILNTVVGNGTSGTGGHGGPATDAELVTPCGLATDAEGNLYIADKGNNVIRKVDKDGIIKTVISGGSYSFNGHTGSSALASFGQIFDIAMDQRGSLYISDAGGNAIKKIDSAGNMSKVVGGFSTSLPSGGDCGYMGDLWYPDNARLQSVAVSNEGDVYIADYWDKVIRRVSPLSGMTRVAGDPNAWDYGAEGCPALSAALSNPRRVVVDHEGNVILTDEGHVRKVDLAGKITTIAGGGTVDQDGVAPTIVSVGPAGLAIEPSGNLLITDASHNRIRRVNIASVGVKQQDGAGRVELWPNPNKGVFTISEMPGSKEENRLEVIDVTGKTVYTHSYRGGTAADVALPATIPNGVYSGRMIVGERVFINRFVVER